MQLIFRNFVGTLLLVSKFQYNALFESTARHPSTRTRPNLRPLAWHAAYSGARNIFAPSFKAIHQDGSFSMILDPCFDATPSAGHSLETRSSIGKSSKKALTPSLLPTLSNGKGIRGRSTTKRIPNDCSSRLAIGVTKRGANMGASDVFRPLRSSPVHLHQQIRLTASQFRAMTLKVELRSPICSMNVRVHSTAVQYSVVTLDSNHGFFL